MFSRPDCRDIGTAGCLDLAETGGSGMRFAGISGRGGTIRVPGGWTSVWLQLAGSLHLQSPYGDWRLRTGRFLAWTDGGLRAHCRDGGHCLVLAAPHAAWGRRLESGPGLLSNERACPRELRRLLVHVQRRARGRAGGPGAMDGLLQAIAASLLECQRDLDALLPRCNGRSLPHRQRNLQRLLRVRHAIRHHPAGRPDTAQLARIASFSPHHLIRIHRDVFGETPMEYALRLRTIRAWNLVRNTDMPVCEITEALGFESQSAFCRAFKKSFGVTTGQVRDGAWPVARAAGGPRAA